jgi:hypothetical protein
VACCLDRWLPAIVRNDSAWAMDFDHQLSRADAGPVLSANLSQTLAARIGGMPAESMPATENPIGAPHADRTILPQLARTTH